MVDQRHHEHGCLCHVLDLDWDIGYRSEWIIAMHYALTEAVDLVHPVPVKRVIAHRVEILGRATKGKHAVDAREEALAIKGVEMSFKLRGQEGVVRGPLQLG